MDFSKLLDGFVKTDMWISLSLICLSQIWVKKETKTARFYDISHFASIVRRCSESNLICMSQIWVKKETSTLKRALFKWTLLAIDLDCLPKVWKNSDIWANSDNLSPVLKLISTMGGRNRHRHCHRNPHGDHHPSPLNCFSALQRSHNRNHPWVKRFFFIWYDIWLFRILPNFGRKKTK